MQEQLAVLTRFAIADLLREEGRPMSLILDDPLVYAADIRLDLMTEFLTEASQHMQVTLMTCRERAFRYNGRHQARSLTSDCIDNGGNRPVRFWQKVTLICRLFRR